MRSDAIKQDDDVEKKGLSWDERLHQALNRYSKIKGIQPALIPALTEGLTQWAAGLPYAFQDDKGCYLPVHTWGLGPEYNEIYALVDWLILQNRINFAESLRKKFETLHRTAGELDDIYPIVTDQGQAAEKRLVRIGRRQTELLVSFLEGLLTVAFRSERKTHPRSAPVIAAAASSAPVRKRSRRATDIECCEKALIEYIHSARDHAWAAIHAGKAPQLLPRPLQKELAQQTGLKSWSLSRCLNDSRAHQLRVLWQVAGDLEQILRFKKK